MNRRQLEVQKKQLADEKQILKELKQVYQQASRDCETKIRELSMRTDMENLQSVIYQRQYQEVLKSQIDAALNDLQSHSFTTVADYLTTSYENGFIGTLYDLQGQGIPLIFPIDQRQVVQAVELDSKISNGLYSRMGEDVGKLKKAIRFELSRGTANGSSWNEIAGNIANGMNSPFNKAMNRSMLIARTEGHRVRQTATNQCLQTAKSKGADVVKQWDSTLDGKTRPTHRLLDGQVRELDELFEVEGKKARFPSDFGDPSEDCNCRCCLLQRARWAVEKETAYEKWNNEDGGLIECSGYEDFRTKYLEKVSESGIMSIRKSVEIPKDCEYLLKRDTNFDGKDIPIDFLKVINNTIENRLKEKYDFTFDEIKVGRFPVGDKSVFITDYEYGAHSKTFLYLNKKYFDGGIANLKDFNTFCMEHFKSGWWKSKSLSDLVNHEIMHAKIVYNCSYSRAEALYQYLEEDLRVKGFCRLVDSQPGEFLNEMFVALNNGETIEQKYIDVYNEYIKNYLGG